MASNPTFEELAWPVLQALNNLGGSGNLSEIIEALIKNNLLSHRHLDSDRASADGSRLSRQLYLALIYLRKGGAITPGGGSIWTVSAEGESLTEADIPGLVSDIRLSHQLFFESLYGGESDTL